MGASHHNNSQFREAHNESNSRHTEKSLSNCLHNSIYTRTAFKKHNKHSSIIKSTGNLKCREFVEWTKNGRRQKNLREAQLQLSGHMNKQIYRLWGTSSSRIIYENPQNPHRATEDFELAKCLECPRFLLVTLSQYDNGVAVVLDDVGVEDMRLQ